MADVTAARDRARPLRLVATAPLTWTSGHDLLLMAVRRLLDRQIPVTLRIVHDGSGDADGEEQVRFDIFDLGLQDAVSLHRSSDARTELRAADLYVLTAVRGTWRDHVTAASDAGLAVVVPARTAAEMGAGLDSPCAAVVPDRHVDSLVEAIASAASGAAPVRVVLVLDRFPAPSEGFIVDKVIGLLRRGVDLHVVCWELDDATLDLHPELAGSEVRGRIHAFPGRNARGVLALVARTIRSARRRPRTTARLLSTLPGSGTELARRLGTEATIAALDPDVVHFEFGWVAIRHIRLGDALPVPLTMSVRGADVAYHGLDRDDTYGEVWPRLAGLHCLGDDLWQRAQQRGCPSSMPVARIPPAVDVDRFAAPTRTPRAGADAFNLLTVARLHWKKGIEHGLHAVRRLLDDGVDVRYRIVGDGPHRPAVEACIADLDLGATVSLLGSIPRTQVPSEMAGAHALLHPALSEGFGNAVLEAQAMELPVVTTDAEGLAENVEDGVTGFVVARRDPAALADRLRILAGDPELAVRFGRSGRQRVATRFGPHDQIGAFVDFYEAALSRR